MNEILMKDLPMVSKTGKWIIKVGNQRKPAGFDMFLVKMKAAMMNKEDCEKMFGKDSRTTRKAVRNYNFYESQLDPEQSDTFALMMFKTEEWKV